MGRLKNPMIYDAWAGMPLTISLTATRLGHVFPATFMGTRNLAVDDFVTHQETRLYAGANQTPSCFVFLSGVSNGGGIYECQFSGFLVDVP